MDRNSGSKGLGRKNYEAGVASGAGAGRPFFLREPNLFAVGAPGRAPDGPPRFADDRRDLRLGFYPRRYFLRPSPLLPGHKSGLPRERIAKVKVGKACCSRNEHRAAPGLGNGRPAAKDGKPCPRFPVGS